MKLIFYLFFLLVSYSFSETKFLILQNGVNEYFGCTDIMLDKENPAIADVGSEELVMQDTTKKSGCCLINYKKNILIKFEIPSLKDRISLKSAKLKLFIEENDTINTNGPITIYPVFTNWDLYTISWNNMPTYSALINSKSEGAEKNGWQEIDITNIVNLYLVDRYKNYGFVMSFDNKGYEIIYSSSDNLNISHRPVLQLEYLLEESSNNLNFEENFGKASIVYNNKFKKFTFKNIENLTAFKLFDLSGKMIFNKRMTGNDKSVILPEDLSEGFYILNVASINQTISKKFIY